MSDDKETQGDKAIEHSKDAGSGGQDLNAKHSKRMRELGESHLELRTKLLNEQIKDMRAARRDRRTVARLAIGIPLALLVLPVLVLMFPSLFSGFFHDEQTGMWPKIILISSPLLTFIFVFGALVRGVFSPAKGANGEQRPEQLVERAARHWGNWRLPRKPYCQGISPMFSTPTPTTIRIVRIFDAPLDLIWRAHTEPALVKQWMTGPADHSLPVCEIDFRVGGKARYVWKNPEFEMGMTAEFKQIVPHERIVHTELFQDWPEGSSVVATNFSEANEQTTVTVNIEYPNQEIRDNVMQPDFEAGYTASYQTLEEMLPTLGS